jgi:hypothetical protein
VLTSDNYYFSYTHDISRCAQSSSQQQDNGNTPLWQLADERFYFNRFLQRRMIDITLKDSDQDLSAFILPVVSGFMEMRQGQIGSSGQFTFAILSRRACGRLGKSD